MFKTPHKIVVQLNILSRNAIAIGKSDSVCRFDYGVEYIQQNLNGRCHCGTAACVGKLSADNAKK